MPWRVRTKSPSPFSLQPNGSRWSTVFFLVITLEMLLCATEHSMGIRSSRNSRVPWYAIYKRIIPDDDLFSSLNYKEGYQNPGKIKKRDELSDESRFTILPEWDDPDFRVYDFIEQFSPLHLLTSVKDKELTGVPYGCPVHNYDKSSKSGSCNWIHPAIIAKGYISVK